jgi:hypothetical protein
MRRKSLWSLLLLVGSLAVACSDPSDPAPASTDAGGTQLEDAGLPAGSDAGEDPDAAVGDDAGLRDDAGEGQDAGVTFPLAGFGAISGDCNVLDDELTSADPSIFVNHIDFGTDPYDAADLSQLTAGGQVIVTTENAGGSSVLSEAFAYEMLARCELASLLKTETQISYVDPQGKITDILVEIDGIKIGVSVVRAVGYPPETYSLAEAKRIITKKLQGVLDSTANVASTDAWRKQILEVIAYAPEHAAYFQQAWDEADPALKADTILMITISDGSDSFLY